MANPLVAQGSLNRLRASVIWPDFPDLNVTASYLGAEGIRLALDGGTTVFLPSMTGAVTSPEPYQMFTMTMALLKTQQLAQLYKAKMESDAMIGDGQVHPDVPLNSPGIGIYQLINCAIENVAEQAFSGTDAGFRVSMRGYVLINSLLWET
jgi:hypothetical protein